MTKQEAETVFQFWMKLHRETECGIDGIHWAECKAVQDLLEDSELDEQLKYWQLRP